MNKGFLQIQLLCALVWAIPLAGSDPPASQPWWSSEKYNEDTTRKTEYQSDNYTSGNDQSQNSKSPAYRHTGFTSSETRRSAAIFPPFFHKGIWHVWAGPDHLLFLFVLILPALVGRAENAPEQSTAQLSGSDRLLRMLIIVTAFSVAHSITTVTSALSWIELPERSIEILIALSVSIVAVVNFHPDWRHTLGLWLAFGFGLIHGLDSTNLLSQQEAAVESLALPLLAFNLGTAVGQAMIVLAIFPIRYAILKMIACQSILIPTASALIAIVAGYWLWTGFPVPFGQ